MKKAQKTYLLIILLAAGVFTVSGWQTEPAAVDGQTQAVLDVVAATSDGNAADTSVPDARYDTGLEDLPASLRGTEVDGGFEIDQDGHLVVTRRTRNLFDYFLSTLGEESLGAIVARLRAYIDHHLEAPARGEAHALLEGYLAYLSDLESISEGPAFNGEQLDVAAMRARLDQLSALRAQHLPRTAVEAFFANENAYDRYVLDRQALMQDDALTQAQRRERLTMLEQQLPPGLRESLAVAGQHLDLVSATEDCRQRDCPDSELRALREQIVGAEAADRLEALDREEAEWEQRLGNWLQQRQALLSDTSLAEQDREAQVERMRSQLFTEDEQMRVRSLEALHDAGESPH